MRVDLDNAISFLTAAVRITRKSGCRLMDPVEWRGKTYIRWDVKTDLRLREHFRYSGPLEAQNVHLRPIEWLASSLLARFEPEVRRAGVTGRLINEHKLRKPQGILAYQQLSWLDSRYLSWPKSPTNDGTSSALAFRTRDNDRTQRPHWREYLLETPEVASASYDELAAVYGVLGLQAQRRMLMSASAQRRMHKIALPWARVRFKRQNGTLSREYMLVPVLTLWSRGKTTQLRRTLALTVYLLPNRDRDDKASALALDDLARVCHQSVWLPARPSTPTIVGIAGDQSSIDGPMHAFVADYLAEKTTCLLPDVFDAVVRRVLRDLGVDTTGREPQIRARVAISRSRSAMFGTALRLAYLGNRSIWNQLRRMRPRDQAELVGKVLSVNGGRPGREWLVDGDGLQLERMRVTNAYEEDMNAFALYNPMSRFILNINPWDDDLFTPVALNFNAAWLDLLATTVCSIKEILRSHRHETQRYRDEMVSQLGAKDTRVSDGRDPLNELHEAMLTAVDDLDPVYGPELVGQAYKAAHARILEMENIPQEREHLLRELDLTTALFRTERANELSAEIAASTRSTDQLSVKIAESVRSTDWLTSLVFVLSLASTMIAANAFIDTLVSPADYHNMLLKRNIDGITLAVGALAIVVLVVMRLRASKSGIELLPQPSPASPAAPTSPDPGAVNR